MDLAALKKVDQSQLQTKRHTQSEQQYQRGLDLIQKAIDADFEDLGCIQRASQCFLTALRMNRTAPGPYLGQAYIFFLLKNYPIAIHYLKRLLERHPNNELAHMLMADIQRCSRPQASSDSAEAAGQAHAPTDAAVQSGHQLYADTEAEIHKLVQTIVQMPPLTPTLSLTLFRKMEQSYRHYQKGQAHFEKRLTALEADCDIAPLKKRLRPLYQLLDRFEQVLKYSRRFNKFHLKVSAAIEELRSLTQKAEACHSLSEVQDLQDEAEAFIEQGEDFNKKLEQLTQMAASQELEVIYQQFMQSLDLFNDTLDDAEIRALTPK